MLLLSPTGSAAGLITTYQHPIGNLTPRLKRITDFFSQIIGSVDTALISGSGLGAVANSIATTITLSTGDIPEFPVPSVHGHEGTIRYGYLGTERILHFVGRVHSYEGCTPDDIRLPVQLAYNLGARRICVTNASGGLNPLFDAGDLMLITDFIPMPFSPIDHFLHAPRGSGRLPRCLRPELAQLFHRKALQAGLFLREGVYAMTTGPSYETRAEIRMLRRSGADAVGMSSVPELIEALRLGMTTVGIACITNTASEIPFPVEHHDVTDTASRTAPILARLLAAVLTDEAWNRISPGE